MPKLKEIGKTSSTPNILQMALPDAATRAFWKMTADDRDEYASRIAKFPDLSVRIQNRTQPNRWNTDGATAWLQISGTANSSVGLLRCQIALNWNHDRRRGHWNRSMTHCKEGV